VSVINRSYRTVPVEEALFRAAYYRWCARKGSVTVGNDPITGRKKSIHRELDRAEGRVANIALARFWLAEARKRRLAA
jgi:hypothetical protein